MVQSPSWEANWFAASPEIPRISRNPKVHYRTHKRPPPVSILGQHIPVHILTSHLLEIHPNIIHPSTPRFPQWFLPSGFPTKTLFIPSPHPYAPHAQPISFFSILSPAQYKSVIRRPNLLRRQMFLRSHSKIASHRGGEGGKVQINMLCTPCRCKENCRCSFTYS